MPTPTFVSTSAPPGQFGKRQDTNGKVQEGIATFVDVVGSFAFIVSICSFAVFVLCFFVVRCFFRRLSRKARRAQEEDVFDEAALEANTGAKWAPGGRNRLKQAAKLLEDAGSSQPQDLKLQQSQNAARSHRVLFSNSGAEFCRKQDNFEFRDEWVDHASLCAMIDQKRIVFSRLGFSIGSLSLGVLETIVDLLSTRPELDVRVAGYAGKMELHTFEQVRELSTKRAKACAEKLVELGAINLLKWQGAGIDRKFDYGFARIVPAKRKGLLEHPQDRLDCIFSRAVVEFDEVTQFLTRRGWQIVDMCWRILREFRGKVAVVAPSEDTRWQADAVMAAFLRKGVSCTVVSEFAANDEEIDRLHVKIVEDHAADFILPRPLPPLQPIYVEELDIGRERSCSICDDFVLCRPIGKSFLQL